MDSKMTDMEIFKAAVDFIETSAIVAATVVGILGLYSWRKEMFERRRAEVAENAMALFHEAKDIVMRACSPIKERTAPGEAAERTGNLTVDLAFQAARDLNATLDFWGRFGSSKYTTQAVFGQGVDDPYQDFDEIRRDIQITCGSIARRLDHGRPDETPEERQRQIASLSDRLHGSHFVERAVAAVDKMERICRPAIKGFYAKRPRQDA